MIFTSKLGVFDFPDNTSLALAKVVRDTVTGQWLDPKPGNPILHSEQDCYSFIRNHSSDLVATVPFEISLR